MELAEEIFHKPVSIGMPRDVKGLSDIVRNPIYATGVGLLQYGRRQESGRDARAIAPTKNEGIVDRLMGWWRNNF